MTEKSEHIANEEDVKRKFQEALAQKNRGAKARKAQEQGRLKVGAMQGPAARKRTFRRKTG